MFCVFNLELLSCFLMWNKSSAPIFYFASNTNLLQENSEVLLLFEKKIFSQEKCTTEKIKWTRDWSNRNVFVISQYISPKNVPHWIGAGYM